MYLPNKKKFIISKGVSSVKEEKPLKMKTKKVGLAGKVMTDYDDKGAEVGKRPRDLKKKLKRVIKRAAEKTSSKKDEEEEETKKSQYVVEKFDITVIDGCLEKFNLKKGTDAMNPEKFEQMMIEKGLRGEADLSDSYGGPVQHKGSAEPVRVKASDATNDEDLEVFSHVEKSENAEVALKKGFFDDKDFINIGPAIINTPWGKQNTGVLLNQEGSAFGKALILIPEKGRQLVDVEINEILLEKAEKAEEHEDEEQDIKLIDKMVDKKFKKMKKGGESSLLKSLPGMHGVTDEQIASTVGKLSDYRSGDTEVPWSFDPSQVRVTENAPSSMYGDAPDNVDPAVAGRFDPAQRPDDGFSYLNSSQYFTNTEGSDKNMMAQMQTEIGLVNDTILKF